MTITPRGMSIQEAYRLFRDNSLLVNRRYQRKLVWSVSEKQLLIRSILDGYPIPLILLAERPEMHGSGRYEIIDGMQRLDAIFSFIEQRYSFQGEYFDLDQNARAKQAAEQGAFEPVDIAGPVMDGEALEGGEVAYLSAGKCADLLDYQLAATIYPTSSEEEITEVFGRINANGRQLSPQEKRQSGVLNPFSELVRGIASTLRGDVSADIVSLQDMPSVSVESSRERQQYGVKAEETLWCGQGILNVKQLREGEDEQMIADIAASILEDDPLAASKELLDEIYEAGTPANQNILDRLASYGAPRLAGEIEATFSVLEQVVDTELPTPNGLRNLVRPGGGNPIKTPFYTIFMAFFELVVKRRMTPADYAGITGRLRDVARRLTSGRHYIASDDRVTNITLVVGLIQNYFVAKEPPSFSHGPGLALDFANSLRRSKIETSRYEFKQGLLRLDTSRDIDVDLLSRLNETICAISNTEPKQDGFLFVGVADKLADVSRIASLDGVRALKVGDHHVVGIDREAKVKGWPLDRLTEKLIQSIRSSDLSEPLKAQVLSSVDTIEYMGLSVIRVRIPGQPSVSFCGDLAFVRQGSSTIQVAGPQLAALVQKFSSS